MSEMITDEYLNNLITAVEDEGAEAKAFSASYTLGKGVKIPTASQRLLYSFSLANPPRLQEEARGRLAVRGLQVECTVISRRADGLDVATFVDLGDELDSAVLTVDRSETLSVLAARLEGIKSGSHQLPFNRVLAGQVARHGDIQPGGDDGFISAPEDLTSDQKDAFRQAIQNRVTYLWGPPGTGKTVTLSAIAFRLFCHNKRVLLVSHTNRAVDGIAHGLCKRIVGKSRASIPEGSVVRVGSISRKGFASSFGAQVSLESLAEHHQRKVRDRVAAVRKEQEANAAEIVSLRDQYALTARKEVLEGELAELQKMLADARGSESGLSTVLRVLRIRYGTGDGKGGSVGDIKRSIQSVTSEILGVVSQLERSGSAEELCGQIEEAEARECDLDESLRDLEALAEDSSVASLERARVVACTATQAVLRCASLGEFDVVIVDEASMLPLPYVVFLSGMAREKVVVGGDFRQLPPISLSSSPAAKMWFARDIFEAAGVVDLVDRGEVSPYLATLTTQFRGHDKLAALINDRFYGGRLISKRKAPDAAGSAGEPTGLFHNSIVVVDTAGLKPVGHFENRSKVNLVHALVARNVCCLLRQAGLFSGVNDVGVISPYRPQVSLIEDLLDEAGMPEIAVGTAHRFQGAERDTIVLDLTESDPHAVGTFLGPVSVRDAGAKLLNVSLSRAQLRLVIIANLSYLRQQLSERHVLHGILEDVTRVGTVVNALDVFPDAVSGPSLAGGEPHAAQRFDEETFLAGLSADIQESESSIVIASSRISNRAAHIVATVARPQVARGVAIDLLCPREAHSAGDEEHQDAVSVLEGAGIRVHKTSSFVHDGVVIDHQIVWMGSSPPLDCLAQPGLIMTRVVSSVVASVVSRLTSLGDTGEHPESLVANA
jgi:hypothetical protein